MSALVGAVKTYAYMDRGELVEVDLHEGLETTLAVLGHKLKHTAIEVVRDYDRDLPRLTVRGSELNQVWTNLLDNAIDALGEPRHDHDPHAARRRLRRSSRSPTTAPASRPRSRERIFDSFFTTKDVGQGTGPRPGDRAPDRRRPPRRRAHRRLRAGPHGRSLVTNPALMAACTHLDQVEILAPPEEIAGCEECLKTGDRWVHLRMCQTCGKIGCCDSSPNRHASRHAAEDEHPDLPLRRARRGVVVVRHRRVRLRAEGVGL